MTISYKLYRKEFSLELKEKRFPERDIFYYLLDLTVITTGTYTFRPLID